MVVASAAEETDPLVGTLVPGHRGLDAAGQLQLGQGRGDLERSLKAVLRWDEVEKLLERVEADRAQHDADVVGRVRDIRHGVWVPVLRSD